MSWIRSTARFGFSVHDTLFSGISDAVGAAYAGIDGIANVNTSFLRLFDFSRLYFLGDRFAKILLLTLPTPVFGKEAINSIRSGILYAASPRSRKNAFSSPGFGASPFGMTNTQDRSSRKSSGIETMAAS